jgi:hypothetical protein
MILDFITTRSTRGERTTTKRISNAFIITFMEARERLLELQASGMLAVDETGWYSPNVQVQDKDLGSPSTRKRNRLTYGQVFLGSNQTRRGY